MRDTIFTIGHSTLPLKEFVEILKAYDIQAVIDVRTIPKSRHNPQFEEHSLDASLAKNNIGYIHLSELGGLRRPAPDSINTAWRNKSFRGYADYMQTPEFDDGIGKLKVIAATKRVAIMCAEAVPWRCHRSLIGDALLVNGIKVIDIMSKKTANPHTLTPFARVEGDKISYPAQ